MQYTHHAQTLPDPAGAPARWAAAGRGEERHWPPVRQTMPAWLANSAGDRLFVDMLHAFRPTGGLARESELLARWRGRPGAGALGWHEALGGEPLIRFDWGEAVWLPLFQFVPGELAMHPVAAQIVAELQPSYDGWSLANWFAQPNTWLGDQRPVDMLADHPARLLEAARVDRFIVAG
ncbi:MAG TPA: hypothetical protein VLA16_10755 [Ideonella sp.]|nr:hypothetical protein [Ideonella sp.]